MALGFRVQDLGIYSVRFRIQGSQLRIVGQGVEV